MFLAILIRVVTWLISRIPKDKDVGDEVLNLCLFIFGKAVQMTETTADDELYEAVVAGLKRKKY